MFDHDDVLDLRDAAQELRALLAECEPEEMTAADLEPGMIAAMVNREPLRLVGTERKNENAVHLFFEGELGTPSDANLYLNDATAMVHPDPDDIETDQIERLKALAVEVCGDDDPDALESRAEDYEPTLIAEDHFPDYAEELARDIGAISSTDSMQWPLNCIDWERAAAELAQDYTQIEWDGHTYYLRS